MFVAVQQEDADVILLREPVYQRGQLLIADVALHCVGGLGDLPRFVPAVEASSQTICISHRSARTNATNAAK